MSDIRKMNIKTLVTIEGNFCSDPQPGDIVRFQNAPNSLGTIVKKINDNEVEVLWSSFGRIYL